MHVANKCCNICTQGDRRQSGGYEGLDPADIETLRTPQRPHDYASMSSTQLISAQPHVSGSSENSSQVIYSKYLCRKVGFATFCFFILSVDEVKLPYKDGSEQTSRLSKL